MGLPYRRVRRLFKIMMSIQQHAGNTRWLFAASPSLDARNQPIRTILQLQGRLTDSGSRAKQTGSCEFLGPKRACPCSSAELRTPSTKRYEGRLRHTRSRSGRMNSDHTNPKRYCNFSNDTSQHHPYFWFFSCPNEESRTDHRRCHKINILNRYSALAHS